MGNLDRLLELAEDWKYFSQSAGLRTAVQHFLLDIARLPYRHLKFVVLACSLDAPAPVWQLPKQLLIRSFEKADLDLVRIIDRPSEARLSAKRLSQGDSGFVAFWDAKPAGYSWGSPDLSTQLERVHPKLLPGDVLFTDAFTAPALRGKGIQTALTLARLNLFRELGYRRAISYIESQNSPSLAVWQRKFTSQVVGRIDFLRIGAWYKVQYG